MSDPLKVICVCVQNYDAVKCLGFQVILALGQGLTALLWSLLWLCCLPMIKVYRGFQQLLVILPSF